jgi:PAS domain S-box-containing protein/diguanylate cyclase (GGDEF)-like protein
VGSLNTELLEEIVSLSAQSQLVVDASNPAISIVYANPAYEEASGYTSDELDGVPWLDHAAADEDTPEIVRLRQSIVCGDPIELSLPFLRKDGDIWLARLSLSPLRHSDADRRLWLVQHRVEDGGKGDSGELLKRVLGRARRKLASVDRTDPVTGLLARGQFELLLRRELAVSRRERRCLNLMVFAVPELDVYRRTFGDNAADSCLRMIGAQIAGTFRRASDLCARLDESTLAVAMLGQDAEQASQLGALVEKKTRNLGLHNPRGHLGRYVVVRGAGIDADLNCDSVDSLIARALAMLHPAECEAEEAQSVAVSSV